MIAAALLAAPVAQVGAAAPRASAAALAEQVLPPAVMADLAQAMVLRELERLRDDPRFARARRLAGDPRAAAAIDRFAEPALASQAAAIAAERPGLLAVLARRYAADFSEAERRRILAFLASPAGRLHEAGGPASFRQPAITAFYASPTGRRFVAHGEALFEGRDVAAWRDAAAARMRARLSPSIDRLAAELDHLARSPS